MSAEITSYVRPVRLYRYRSIQADDRFERELRAIEGGYIYSAEYTRMNDPMEGLYTSSRMLRQSARYRRIRDAIARNKEQIGVASFSEVYDNELMWAHYADQFGGICIAYQLTDLLENLPDGVEFIRMYYNEEVPTVGLTKKSPSEIAKTVLSHKNHRWLYEREWRMFGPRGRIRYGDPTCVARVYLGFRIESDRRREIERRMRRVDIPTAPMDIDGYTMSFTTMKPQPSPP